MDWTDVGDAPMDRVECECFRVYRTHSKGVVVGGSGTVVATRLACPSCGQKHLVRRVLFPDEL